MNSRSLLFKTLFLTAVSVSLSACTDDETLVDNGDTEVASADLALHKSEPVAIAFTSFDDDEIDPAVKPESIVFTTQTAYRKHFGHRAPDVDFPREWVAYYSAGLQTSDGHVAAIRGLRVSGNRLEVTTSLESPGAACEIHALPEVPHVLVKFKAPSPRPHMATFDRADSLHDCTAPTTPPGGGTVAADCATRQGGAMVTIEVADTASERYTTWVSASDGEFIDEAKRLVAAGEKRVPTFKVLDGTDCDASWGFHLDAVDASFADFTTEVCDALPSYLNQNKAEWLQKNLRWCPWGARVVSVDDRRASFHTAR
jgi:hypothetical protein